MIPKRNIVRNIRKSFMQPGYAWRVFRHRLKSYLSYRLLRGYAAYPEALTLFLTHRCNLRCKMCGQWELVGVTKSYLAELPRKELTFDELKGLIDDVFTFKPNITLFGGEPLLHKYCFDLIKYIKQKKLHCCLLTNGTLLKKWAKEIMDNEVDEVNVSLDGPEKIHNEIRGIPGVFTKITEGINQINKLKRERGTTKPLFNIICTMSSLNYSYLEEMVEVAQEIQASSLSFHHLIFISREIFDKHNRFFMKEFGITSKDWRGFILDDIGKMDVHYLIDKISRIKRKKYNLPVDFYPNFTNEEIKKYYTNPHFIPETYSNRCLSPWMVSYIYPNGDVWPCLTLGYLAGNIKQKRFTEIWNNEKYRRFRMIVKKEGFPVCPKCTEFYRY